MAKLKELAMMWSGMAGFWAFWFYWPKEDRDGLTTSEKVGLWMVGITGVIGTIAILAGVDN